MIVFILVQKKSQDYILFWCFSYINNILTFINNLLQAKVSFHITHKNTTLFLSNNQLNSFKMCLNKGNKVRLHFISL